MKARWMVAAALSLLGSGARATPFFARTYGYPCATCHSGFPRLNAFGLAFKANAFRIPGSEAKEALAWQKSVPISLRVRPEILHSFNNPGSGESQDTDTQILAGGLLTRKTAFYLHHDLWDDATPITPFPSHELWVQEVVSERGKIMLKAGQFELPIAYSPVINATTVSSPLALFARLQPNDVLLAAPVSGIQVSGAQGSRVQWYAEVGAPGAIDPGTAIGERQFSGRFRDVFLRAATGPPDRNTGFFAYFTHPDRDPRDPSSGDHAFRVGVDAYWIVKGVQLQGMALYGENAHAAAAGQKGALRSAFIEADRMVAPWAGITLRLDVSGASVGGTHTYRDAGTIAARLYPLPFLKVSAEFQVLDHGRSATAFLADIAF